MERQTVHFTGSLGDELTGTLELPAEPRATAVFAHCFTCSRASVAASRVSRALAARGLAVLRFDFTGLGSSEGEFAETGYSSNVDDLVAAADWLRDHHGAPALLIGHSLGGAAALAAAHRIDDARAIATVGAPFDPAHVTRLFDEPLDRISAEGQATVRLGGRPFTVKRAFLDDLTHQRQDERIRHLDRPVMVLHDPADTVVGIDNATGIFTTARHPKSFVSLDRAGHLLTRAADARYAGSVIAAWAGRYLEAAERPADTSAGVDAPDEAVHVTERGTGTFAVAISAGRHGWLADEPPAVGGDDLGPNPYQMLSAALGACTAMTMRMYARHKQWPLENVSVTLSHEKIHAKDCAECETRKGKIDRIERGIRIDGELDEAQRQWLMEIADRCPVHRTLHSEVQVVTTGENGTGA